VIRLIYVIRRPRPQGRLSRRDVFLRDRYACQYCGRHTRDLTLDHVIPRKRGGPHDWTNVVAACKACNHRKAGRTPDEAHMRLIRAPLRPSFNPYRPFYHYLSSHMEWRNFVPGYEADQGFS
jgi:5-methylcytosine-specific restriction endonuclease McrA